MLEPFFLRRYAGPLLTSIQHLLLLRFCYVMEPFQDGFGLILLDKRLLFDLNLGTHVVSLICRRSLYVPMIGPGSVVRAQNLSPSPRLIFSRSHNEMRAANSLLLVLVPFQFHAQLALLIIVRKHDLIITHIVLIYIVIQLKNVIAPADRAFASFPVRRRLHLVQYGLHHRFL